MSPDELRSLTNPPARREIRPDFPRTISLNGKQEILEVIEHELAKYGTNLDQVGHITLAYPHKHPELFPGHFNAGEWALNNFRRALKKGSGISPVEWLVADGLVETVSLGRSENQTSIHALMAHQIYEVHVPSQTMPLPFLEQNGKNQEFLVIVDDGVDQGTTVANMMSYIEHNGGTVLAVAEHMGLTSIAQVDPCKLPQKLSKRFNDETKNTARMESVAAALSDSAGREGFNLSPEQCLALLEKGINKNCNSVYALTDGECRKLTAQMKIDLPCNFSLFLKELGVELPVNDKPRTPKPPAVKA